MYSQRGPLRESFRTLVALVRFLTGVHSPVHPEILRVGETLATDVADVRFLAGVDPSVFLQVFRAAETLAAVIAQIELRGIVALFVTEQGPLRSQHPATNVARRARHFVGLHFRMHASAVSGELPSQVESTAAQLANERLVPGVYVVVLLQIDRLPETLVAVVALEREIRLVRVSQHVNAERGQHGRFVVALLAHVTRIEVSLLVPGQIAEQPELLRAVFASQVADSVPHQMFLVVALVPEHLVARFTEELQLWLLFLYLQSIGTTARHRRRAARFTPSLATRVLLHVLSQIHVRSEHPAALGASVLTFTLVLDLVIVQQRLRSEKHTAQFTVVSQRQILFLVLVVHFLLDKVALLLDHRQDGRVGAGRSQVRAFRGRRRALRVRVLLHQVELRQHRHRVILFGEG